ncbi:MAG: ABC transporter substrate-binding protein [Candidatus Saccharibacteria bacterium]
MQLRSFRLRFRRRYKQREKQAQVFGQQAEASLERLFVKRFGRLLAVRRFVIGWIALFILLIIGVVLQNLYLGEYYQNLQPVPGGIYSEGVLGTFSTANPLYATSDVDNTVSRLLFSGLFGYNQHNQLTGNLASNYRVDEKGTTYTVHLRPHLTWHDGQPLTSADVLFTYQTIQNPDAKSPLMSGWQGVTISAPDPLTIVFKLPNVLASFPYNLVNGIVPAHRLAALPVADLRSADFNTVNPVGSGPFAWHALQVSGTDRGNAQQQIVLVPFAHYVLGAPKLQEFIVHAYANQSQLVRVFNAGQLNGLEGLSSAPQMVDKRARLVTHDLLLTAGTYVFFKTTVAPLADKEVRVALVEGADPQAIIKRLGFPTHSVREPLLQQQLAYDPSFIQYRHSTIAAQGQLTAAGWKVGKDGLRSKDGRLLTFKLVAPNTPEYRTVTTLLKKQWRAIGVDVQVRLLTGQDFQNALTYHDYDAVLNGISLGVDPDVFVYWDSSQADVRSANRLNLSEYKNSAADTALEAGRTRLDPTLRTIKYKPFLQAWQQDAPALGLYQPRVLYFTNGNVAGLSDATINTATDRLNNVHNWQIREAKVTNN